MPFRGELYGRVSVRNLLIVKLLIVCTHRYRNYIKSFRYRTSTSSQFVSLHIENMFMLIKLAGRTAKLDPKFQEDGPRNRTWAARIE